MKMKRNKSSSPEPSSSSCPRRIKLDHEEVAHYEIPKLHILDFSDDVLLNILKYLSPQDLMSTSLCCQRLNQVAQDRTLWKKVDFRNESILLDELEKYVKFFQPITVSLAIRGTTGSEKNPSLSPEFFSAMREKCVKLKELIIEEYSINGNFIPITDFPQTIEKLSLQGCEMSGLRFDRSYFYKLDQHMPNLTCLILSKCQWVPPHSLLVISKIPKLKELRLNSCHQLSECVAYASLATRFGFKTLEILDLRDTSLGDSEVCCFRSTKTLTHLYLECPSDFRNAESTNQSQQQQQVLRQPIYEDRNLVQFLVDDANALNNIGFQRCLITDRSICVLANDMNDRRVVNSLLEGVIVVEEDRRTTNKPHLKTLVVRNYPHVTNFSLVHLALNASSLEYLDVTGTAVTKSGVQSFRSQKSNVTIISSFDKT